MYKRKKEEVITPASASTVSTGKISAAINARVGSFTISGTVNSHVYSIAEGKKVTISKIGETKIKISAVNFTMGTFEFDVQNGATVSNGLVSGSNDGKAIGYTGSSPFGQIIFSCDESDNIALVVAGTGINSVGISGTK